MTYVGFFAVLVSRAKVRGTLCVAASGRVAPIAVARRRASVSSPPSPWRSDTMTLMENVFRRTPPLILTSLLALASAPRALLAQAQHAGGEANLVIPDLSSVQFFGVPGR